MQPWRLQAVLCSQDSPLSPGKAKRLLHMPVYKVKSLAKPSYHLMQLGCLTRLCQPMAEYFAARGGELRLNARLQSILLDPEGAVDGFRLTDGSTVRGDLYVSAMPGMCTNTPCRAPTCRSSSSFFKGSIFLLPAAAFGLR